MVDTEVEAEVRRLLENLRSGSMLSEQEASFLLRHIASLSDESLLIGAACTLASSGIREAEVAIRQQMETSTSERVRAQALITLCKMGLALNYRSFTLHILHGPVPQNASDWMYGAAIGGAAYLLRDHQDKELANILRELILKGREPDAIETNHGDWARNASLSAVYAVGGDTRRATDDEAYYDKCVERFLSERGMG